MTRQLEGPRLPGLVVTPKQASRRLILLSLPFLAFGLLMAVAPPFRETLGQAAGVVQALGVALVLLALGAILLGVYLARQRDERRL